MESWRRSSEQRVPAAAGLTPDERGSLAVNERLMDPQLGRVGLTEKEARKSGYPIVVG